MNVNICMEECTCIKAMINLIKRLFLSNHLIQLPFHAFLNILIILTSSSRKNQVLKIKENLLCLEKQFDRINDVHCSRKDKQD